MKFHKWTSTAALMLVMPTLALAGGKAVIQSGEGGDSAQSQIEFDGSRLRVQGLGEQDLQGYMILRDGRAYSVIDQGDGKPMVIDMASMMKSVGGLMQNQGMPSPSLGAEGMARFVSLSATGGSETIAGISGRVHTLTYIDTDGKTQTETLVLSKDARVRDLTESLLAMGQVMTQMAGVAENAASEQFAAQFKGQGLLRHGNTFTLVSLSGDRPAASRFELPAAPTQMPDLGSMLGGGAGAEAGADGSGLSLGKLFGNKAERQQQRMEGRTEAEVDEATDSVVDKALDKAFGKIFGE